MQLSTDVYQGFAMQPPAIGTNFILLPHCMSTTITVSSTDINNLQARIQQVAPVTQAIRSQLAHIIIGQHHMIDRLLIGLYCNGHILLEGVPGLAKTLVIKSLAQIVDVAFSRIQFTPDLLPADVLGTMIYNQQRGEFIVRKGPIFANFILADEINRAPAKVQSALLEAMQEKQITLGDTSYHLEEPFLVLATQNPLEQQGTYPLPEAQQDRFMLKVLVSYPTREEELQIVRENVAGLENIHLKKVAGAKEIVEIRRLVREIYIDPKVEEYVLNIVFATRYPADHGLPKLQSLMQYGASPRASINLVQAAKALALLQERAYVVPDDVKQIAPDILRHRIGLSYEADAENISVDDIINQILQKVAVP